MISICIPAYKRTNYLKRLLESIEKQTYRNFEVIVTDDSPHNEVKDLCSRFENKFPIKYQKNETALGTPENWNEAIRLAGGEWIKLMHDDDWFRSPQSLQKYADATRQGKKFIASRYVNVIEGNGEESPPFPTAWKKRIVSQPVTLLATNVIGPPSVTLVHRDIKEVYDRRMKWRVDLDFYIRVLQAERTYTLIDEPLVNVGISNSQVTNDCINLPHVELPEGFLLLDKYGVKPLQKVLVYDAWWRILRNTGTRTEKQLLQFTPEQPWPDVIRHMLSDQVKVPQGLLRNGVISKTAMFLSYLKNQKYLRR